MRSVSLLDPQLNSLFLGMPSPSFNNETIPVLRQAMAGTPIVDAALDVTEHLIDRADGSALRLVVIRPSAAAERLPVVLHCHPGGWMLGTPETSAPTLVDLASNLQCVIVSVDYRLAPEHPFPAAHDDLLAALAWIRSCADDLHIDIGRIVLAGESAGANIAAGAALRLRDEGADAGIAGLSLVYAPLDDRSFTKPDHPYAGTVGLGPDHMRFAWASYLGERSGGDVSPYAAPARAPSFKGLPPVFLAVGAIDPLIDENLEIARRLILEGVQTSLHVFAGAPHGFDRLATADVTIALRQLRNEHVKRCLQP